MIVQKMFGLSIVDPKRQRMPRAARLAFWVALLSTLLWAVVDVRPAAAAEFAAGDVYVLPQGQVISDDLYVAAREIIINGTVDGDLLAAGAYVEINGAVNGSVMAAAAGVSVNGVIQNSVRVAAMSVRLDGAVRKDFLASAGLDGFAVPIGNRTLTPGIEMTANSTVAGDVMVAGGSARVAGTIGGDLDSALARLDLGGHTEGNARIRAETLVVQESARIAGELSYTSRDAVALSESTAASVTYIPWQEEMRSGPQPVNPFWALLTRLWRTAIQLIGLGIIAWLVWTFAPGVLQVPAQQLESRPVEAGLYGVVAVALLVPVVMALVFLGTLFWGWFPGGLTFSAVGFGALSLAWLLSPVVSGLWIGRRIAQIAPPGSSLAGRSELQTLLLGIVAIVVVANVVGAVPCLGAIVERIIYLLSLALAVGGYVMARIRPAPAAPIAVA